MIVNIGRYRLSKRRRHGGRRNKLGFHQDGVKRENLVNVKITNNFKNYPRCIRLATVNAQSLKPKENIIWDYLIQNKIDLCVITETWLKPDDEHWIQGSDLNREGFKMLVSYRKDRQGGGLNKNGNDADSETWIFKDTVEAFGLCMRNCQPTHKKGNFLDLIINESFSPVKVMGTRTGDFISDHCFAECVINIPKTDMEKNVSYRKIETIQESEFMKDNQMNVGDLTNLDLEEQIIVLENKLSRVLDIIKEPHKEMSLPHSLM